MKIYTATPVDFVHGFSELTKRIFKRGVIQNTSHAPDKELNVLIFDIQNTILCMLSYAALWTSKNGPVFVGPPCTSCIKITIFVPLEGLHLEKPEKPRPASIVTNQLAAEHTTTVNSAKSTRPNVYFISRERSSVETGDKHSSSSCTDQCHSRACSAFPISLTHLATFFFLFRYQQTLIFHCNQLRGSSLRRPFTFW